MGPARARRSTQPCHLGLRVDEEGVVVADDAPLGRNLVEHGGVVALPQGEAQRVRVLVAAPERQRDLDRVAHADHEAQLGLEVEPVGGGEARARILEAPVVVLAQRPGWPWPRRPRAHAGIVHTGGRQDRRVVPRPTVASSSSSLQSRIALLSQKPSGLSSAASISSSALVPTRCRPESCSAGDHRRPRAVHPAMAIGTLRVTAGDRCCRGRRRLLRQRGRRRHLARRFRVSLVPPSAVPTGGRW